MMPMNQSMMPYFMQMMQGGGSGMPQIQNNAPQLQIAQGGMSAGPNKVPQPPGPQQVPPGGAIQQTVNTGKNIGTLANWGQQGYNAINNAINPTPPALGQNINASSGAPVANNAAGNAYLQQNPVMQSGYGSTVPNAGAGYGSNPFTGPGAGYGMNGSQAGSQMNGTSGYFGGQNIGGQATQGMFGPMNANGTMAAGSQGMYGAAGAGANGAAAGETAGGTAGTSAASSETPTWLQQIWDYL